MGSGAVTAISIHPSTAPGVVLATVVDVSGGVELGSSGTTVGAAGTALHDAIAGSGSLPATRATIAATANVESRPSTRNRAFERGGATAAGAGSGGAGASSLGGGALSTRAGGSFDSTNGQRSAASASADV
jgi:hypothetical protein